MDKKTCAVCGESKPVVMFYRNNTYTDGRESKCKECRKQYQREWRGANRSKHREYSTAYYRQHKHERSAYYLGWRKKNKKKKDAYDREWRRRNHERVSASRKVWNARRRALKMANGGRFAPSEWLALKDKYGGRCLACGRTEPEVKITPDHIVPLACGGSNTIDNIQPLCWSCNAAKQARVADYRYGRCYHQLSLAASAPA